MYKGPQLQQIQAIQLGVTKALSGKRCVEEQGGRLGRAGDRHSLGYRLRPATFAQPDATMAGVKGRQGGWINHPSGLGEQEQKEN
jgi:hypothetical protein